MTIELNDNDIRKMIAEKFNINADDMELNATTEWDFEKERDVVRVSARGTK